MCECMSGVCAGIHIHGLSCLVCAGLCGGLGVGGMCAARVTNDRGYK